MHVTLKYKNIAVPREHATKDGHLLRLVDFEPSPLAGALTIGEAEALIVPRTLETRKQRCKQLHKEKRASRRRSDRGGLNGVRTVTRTKVLPNLGT